MEPNTEGQTPQKTSEEIIEALQAEIAELKPKAEASSQNFERLKKVEAEKKELEAKLPTGEPQKFDSAKLEQEINDKVDLKVAGYDSEIIKEIEVYAKGRGVSLAEAAKSPFIQKAVDAIRAEKKSTESTPAPSSRIPVFNGKPVDEIFKQGTPAEKQAAFEARTRGVANSSE